MALPDSGSRCHWSNDGLPYVPIDGACSSKLTRGSLSPYYLNEFRAKFTQLSLRAAICRHFLTTEMSQKAKVFSAPMKISHRHRAVCLFVSPRNSAPLMTKSTWFHFICKIISANPVSSFHAIICVYSDLMITFSFEISNQINASFSRVSTHSTFNDGYWTKISYF